MTPSTASAEILRSDHQKSVAAYWDNTAPTGSRGASRQDDVDWLLGEIDGLYHHHYWELREHSPPATGVEEPFLESDCEGSFQYVLIVADRVRG